MGCAVAPSVSSILVPLLLTFIRRYDIVISRSFIEQAYNTKGDELCKYIRSEVAEKIEMQELQEQLDAKAFNRVVKEVMKKIKGITESLVEIELDKQV